MIPQVCSKTVLFMELPTQFYFLRSAPFDQDDISKLPNENKKALSVSLSLSTWRIVETSKIPSNIMKVHSLPKCFFFITMKPENTIPQLGFKQFTSLLTKQEACHNRKVCTFKEREKTSSHWPTSWHSSALVWLLPSSTWPFSQFNECLMIPPHPHRSLFKVSLIVVPSSANLGMPMKQASLLPPSPQSHIEGGGKWHSNLKRKAWKTCQET